MLISVVFGSYIAKTVDVLEEAVEFLKLHPEINNARGVLYVDEGHYLELFYEDGNIDEIKEK